ncbi:MAG: hypothetical protein EBQ92_09325 [Proteobacteria bacterium]|nr:hypothetical protein [Pseudomonadota bacterium]
MKNAALKKTSTPTKKVTTAKKVVAKASDKREKNCSAPSCKKEASTHGYCRLHYISNWKHIRFNEKVKAERRLNAYVDRIAKKYPQDFLEKIKETLEDEKKFKEMVSELDIELDMSPKETDDEFLAKFLRAVKPGSGSSD